MFVVRHQTADSFLDHAQSVLEQNEAANNLMIGIACGCVSPRSASRRRPTWRQSRTAAACSQRR